MTSLKRSTLSHAEATGRGHGDYSDTTVHGAYCLRAAINNHRTRYDDLRLLIKETIRLGEEIANESAIN
jgi:aromatic-L-amino-acid/L-tryptophan decarboxylase